MVMSFNPFLKLFPKLLLSVGVSAGLLALLIIYVILATVFRSFTQPLIIMAVIPFGGWRTMDAMAEHGLVGKKRDAGDERVFRISLTRQGRQTRRELDELWKGVKRANAELLKEVGADLLGDVVRGGQARGPQRGR